MLAVWAAVVSASRLEAQSGRWSSLVTIGSDADDRLRLAHLLGRATADGYLLRSPSSLTPPLGRDSGQLRWSLLEPEFTTVWNSSLPFSLNDGALWAGRGWNDRLRAGLRAQWGPVSLTLAPELLASENKPYDLPPAFVRLPLPAGRSVWSSPWHTTPYSIDLPLRFGDAPLHWLDLGQTTLAVAAGAVSLGLSTENEWWGPGVRNAIVLSSNAAGIPRLFARTRRPLHTRVGSFEARWFTGELDESDYFDNEPRNDWRSISAFGLVWQPRWTPGLALGATRAVYAPLDRRSWLLWRVFDAFRPFPNPNYPSAATARSGRDQMVSLFGRWVSAEGHVGVHAEWARHEAPGSVRDFLIAPNHSQGYTLGLEWANPTRNGRDALRLQAEATYLEKSPNYRYRPVATYYTSRAAAQGYTQRGQVIGAAIGPGASSQWLALDYVAPEWRVGAFAGRIRWDDDALYLFSNDYVNKWCAHDVSLFAGMSGAAAGRWGRAQVSLTLGERVNVFFYNLTYCELPPDFSRILDARNTTLELRISPP